MTKKDAKIAEIKSLSIQDKRDLIATRIMRFTDQGKRGWMVNKETRDYGQELGEWESTRYISKDRWKPDNHVGQAIEALNSPVVNYGWSWAILSTCRVSSVMPGCMCALINGVYPPTREKYDIAGVGDTEAEAIVNALIEFISEGKVR